MKLFNTISIDWFQIFHLSSCFNNTSSSLLCSYLNNHYWQPLVIKRDRNLFKFWSLTYRGVRCYHVILTFRLLLQMFDMERVEKAPWLSWVCWCSRWEVILIWSAVRHWQQWEPPQFSESLSIMPRLFLGNLGHDCRQRWSSLLVWNNPNAPFLYRDIEKMFRGYGDLRNINIKVNIIFHYLTLQKFAWLLIRRVNMDSWK